MKTITIQIPDDCDIQIIKKEEKKKSECKFKKGDVIVSCAGLIAIFEKIDLSPNSGREIVYYSTLYSTINGFSCINKLSYGIGEEKNCRLATKEEVSTLIKALKQKAAKFIDAREVLKEVFNIDYIPMVKTYQDLIINKESCRGYYVDTYSNIRSVDACNFYSMHDRNIASSEKVAKSMLAMAMISQLMPYYGGEITKEEWDNGNMPKYPIKRINCSILSHENCRDTYHFLAFHTEEQREEFLKYNEQLVKDYLMID